MSYNSLTVYLMLSKYVYELNLHQVFVYTLYKDAHNKKFVLPTNQVESNLTLFVPTFLFRN